VHLLIFLTLEAKIKEPTQVDHIISAQIPDPNTHPQLYGLVTKLMVHGPCGTVNSHASCIKDGKCSKGFSKVFVEETTIATDGYVTYACPSHGHTFTTNSSLIVDNRWIVPYSLHIILEFACHANLECCISVQTFKYIHK
jgi:hypothetical protein